MGFFVFLTGRKAVDVKAQDAARDAETARLERLAELQQSSEQIARAAQELQIEQQVERRATFPLRQAVTRQAAAYLSNDPYRYTTPYDPRHRPFTPLNTDQLRLIARSCDIAARCISHLKSEVTKVPLVVVARDEDERGAALKKQIGQANEFLSERGGLGGAGVRRSVFEGRLLDDLLVVGAFAVHLRYETYGTLADGIPDEIRAIDAATIRPLVTPFGFPTDDGAWAYEQWVMGVVTGRFRRDELIYEGLPSFARSDAPFFFSPTEHAAIQLYTLMRTDDWNRSWLTEGSGYQRWLKINESITPDQARDWLEIMDAQTTGNAAERRKIGIAPGEITGDESRRDQDFEGFEQSRITRICSCYGVNPASVGYHGREHKDDQEAAMDTTREGMVAELLLWREQFYNDILERKGWGELRVTEDVPAPHETPTERSARQAAQIAGGVKTVNQIRIDNGDEAVDGGDELLLPSSVVPLSRLLAAPPDENASDDGSTPDDDSSNDEPPDDDEPPGGSTPPKEETARALQKWERKALNRLSRGQSAACGFVDAALDDALRASVLARLESAGDKSAVREVFARVWNEAQHPRNRGGRFMHAADDGRNISNTTSGDANEASPYGADFTRNNLSSAEQKQIQEQGEKAIDQVIAHKADMPSAMTRPDTGAIDFVWGNAGGGPPKNKGAHGIAGIIAKHSEKTARAMPEVMAKGDLGPVYERGAKRNIRYGDYTAIIKLTDRGGKRTWLLNGFGPYEDDPAQQKHLKRSEKRKSKTGLMDTGGGLDPIGPMHQTPTHGILSPGGSSPTDNYNISPDAQQNILARVIDSQGHSHGPDGKYDGGTGIASASVAVGSIAPPPFWEGGTKHTAVWVPGDKTEKGHFQELPTHGESVSPSQVQEWAEHLKIAPKTIEKLVSMADFGDIENDHHLAQILSALTIAAKSGHLTHAQALEAAQNGQDATAMIEAAKANAAQKKAPVASPPVALLLDTPHDWDLFTKSQGVGYGLSANAKGTLSQKLAGGEIQQSEMHAILQDAMQGALADQTEEVNSKHIAIALWKKNKGILPDPNASQSTITPPPVASPVAASAPVDPKIQLPGSWHDYAKGQGVPDGLSPAAEKVLLGKIMSQNNVINHAKLQLLLHDAAQSAINDGSSAIGVDDINAALWKQKNAPPPVAVTTSGSPPGGSPPGGSGSDSFGIQSGPPLQSAGALDKSHFAGIADVDVGEPPLPAAHGKSQSAGILVVEDDGRVWLYEPKGHFGGYEHTFSKGGVEDGLSLQQSAHKELYEELGLTAQITGCLGDFSGDVTNTRYYIARRTGGHPDDAVSGKTQPGASETASVKLVTPDEAAKLLNKPRDKKVLEALNVHLAGSTPAAVPGTPGTPHSVTLKDAAGGQHSFTLDYSQPVSAADVDALKSQVAVSSGGEAALKQAIADGQISSHGQLLEIAAMAQAKANTLGNKSINSTGVPFALGQGSAETLLDSAHHEPSGEAAGVAKAMGAHTFASPLQKSQVAATAKHQVEVAAFHAATPAQHLQNKVGAAKGSNTGGFYALPDGQQTYVKTPKDAGIAHNEHLANKIYSALGIAAPQSKVFDYQNQTHYASKIVENSGTLGTSGISAESAKSLLNGFAADALLGNWDAVGASGDNVVIGKDGTPDGTPTRIDNGGALLYRAKGEKKPASELASLNEWSTLADSKKNPRYADLFAKAGFSNPEQIPTIKKQIKEIVALRESHGGWENFISQAAPQMNESQRKETASMLEARTALLQEKLNSLPGANSLVGQRHFAFSADAAATESSLIAHHQKNGVQMTKGQISAMSSHKGIGYQSAARMLLGKDQGDPSTMKHIERLDEYFKQPGAVIGQDVALSRCIPMKKTEVEKLRHLAPGTIIGNTPVHQSTSTDSTTAISGDDIQLCILAPRETPGVAMRAYSQTSGLAGEREVLLPRGLSYRVVAVMNPGDANAPEVPAGWKWRYNAQSSGVRLVVEPIIPGLNDKEANAAVHHIDEKNIKSGLKKHATPATQSAVQTPDVSQVGAAPWNTT
jgi:8-oxo-dGTP pyrophosphatase MutT (NUDIX family)